MSTLIKETLEKQLQILSERSIRERGEILPDLTRAMINVAYYLEDKANESKETIGDLIALEVNKQLDEHDTALAESLNSAIRKIVREEIDSYFAQPANPLSNLVGSTVLKLMGEYDAALDKKLLANNIIKLPEFTKAIQQELSEIINADQQDDSKED